MNHKLVPGLMIGLLFVILLGLFGLIFVANSTTQQVGRLADQVARLAVRPEGTSSPPATPSPFGRITLKARRKGGAVEGVEFEVANHAKDAGMTFHKFVATGRDGAAVIPCPPGSYWVATAWTETPPSPAHWEFQWMRTIDIVATEVAAEAVDLPASGGSSIRIAFPEGKFYTVKEVEFADITVSPKPRDSALQKQLGILALGIISVENTSLKGRVPLGQQVSIPGLPAGTYTVDVRYDFKPETRDDKTLAASWATAELVFPLSAKTVDLQPKPHKFDHQPSRVENRQPQGNLAASKTK